MFNAHIVRNLDIKKKIVDSNEKHKDKSSSNNKSNGSQKQAAKSVITKNIDKILKHMDSEKCKDCCKK